MKKFITKSIALGVLAGTLMMAAPVFAQTAQSSMQALLDQIVALQKQIDALKVQQKTATTQLVTALKEGDSGSAVEELQAVLFAEGLFSAKITGYYGPVTRKSVMDFQKRYGIPTVGRVGPLTLERIRSLATTADIALEKDNSGSGKKACLPPGKMIAPGQAKKVVPNLPPCKDPLPPGIQQLLGQGGPGSGSGSGTTTPDVVAPAISAVMATSTMATSTLLTWTTNEPATSMVTYATATPLGAGALTATVAGLMTAHAVPLLNLTASTTYYYKVSSLDGAGNLATSTEQSFVTLP
jgi:peptidoglycan hydrolase-like protein with peptidoglycan-binding domain